jgi:hypothetical protein
LVDVLYGDWNPSGHLPYTIAKNSSDYPAHLLLGGAASDVLNIKYTEGLMVDYHSFDSVSVISF